MDTIPAGIFRFFFFQNSIYKNYFYRSGKKEYSERVNIYGPPTSRDELAQVMTKQGYSISLSCPMGGYPLEEAIWKQGENTLLSKNGRVTFEPVKLKDSGNYTCTIENATANVHLKVANGECTDLLPSSCK